MISLGHRNRGAPCFSIFCRSIWDRVRGFKTRIPSLQPARPGFLRRQPQADSAAAWDGIVFVADSQEQRMDANVEALDNLNVEPERARLRLQQNSLRAATYTNATCQIFYPRSSQQKNCQEERSRGRRR